MNRTSEKRFSWVGLWRARPHAMATTVIATAISALHATPFAASRWAMNENAIHGRNPVAIARGFRAFPCDVPVTATEVMEEAPRVLRAVSAGCPPQASAHGSNSAPVPLPALRRRGRRGGPACHAVGAVQAGGTITAVRPTSLSETREAVLSYIGLRRAIGGIGIALPFVLVIGNLLLTGEGLRSSLSSYYYTGMRDIFVGSLCAVGVFLFCYRYDRADDLMANIAGASAIGVALLPTRPTVPTSMTQIVVGWVHLTFAAVFFALLAWFCLVPFTRDDGAPTPRKMVRNTVYRACGIVILACLVLAAVNGILVPPAVANWLHGLFWLESLAALAFGVAWFVKGDTVLRDRP